MKPFAAICLMRAGLACVYTGTAASQTLKGRVTASNTYYAFYNTTAFSPDGRFSLVAEPNGSRVFVFNHHRYSNNIVAVINTGAEPQKAGVLPEDADAFLRACRETYGLSIDGLILIKRSIRSAGVR